MVEAGDFKTYGIPDSWAGYGGMVEAFCADLGADPCKRTDTDTDSAETLRRFAAERNKPGALLGGVGVTYMNEAAQSGILLDYLSRHAPELSIRRQVPEPRRRIVMKPTWRWVSWLNPA